MCIVFLKTVFSVAKVLLVEGQACSHVGLEDLCDRVDVGRCPDVQAQIHPDNDGDDDVMMMGMMVMMVMMVMMMVMRVMMVMKW